MLTPAERRVLEQVYLGNTTDEIADALCITEATVRTHLTHIYGKLNVRGRVQLLAESARHRQPAPSDVQVYAHARGDRQPIDGAPAVDVAQSGAVGLRPPPAGRSWRAMLRRSSIWAAGLLGVAAGLAHLSLVAWPAVGPLMIAAQALLPRREGVFPARLAMLAVGGALMAEQMTVLIALHQAGI